MSDGLGQYAVEVLAAYAVSLGILAGFAVIVWRKSVRVARSLAAAEERSGRRG